MLRNFRILILFILSVLPDIESKAQDEQAVQLSGGIRADVIGLDNYARRKYALFHGETDLGVTISSENLNLFRGGELFIQGMGIFGNQSSANYCHDLQVFSNIENDNRLFLYQAYYKQTLGRFIIKLGQLDLNADYSVSGYGSSLLNSSFGVLPTMSLNMPVSIFAYLTAGISFKYLFSDRLFMQTAFFDGDPGDYETNRHNMKWRFSRSEGFFNITEFHYRTRNNLKIGKYQAGIFYHSNSEGISRRDSTKGNFGFFFMGDQQLLFEKNTLKNGLSIFFQASFSPSSVNLIGSYYSLGLIYRGMFRKMNEDECTLSIASAHLTPEALLNGEYLPHETAIEFTYKKYITPAFILQPDIQYIINTGASKALNGNSTIAFLRTMILF